MLNRGTDESFISETVNRESHIGKSTKTPRHEGEKTVVGCELLVKY